MLTNGNIITHIDLKTIAEKIADLAGSKETMSYDNSINTYYINGVKEDMLKQLGFEYLCSDIEERPIYKYYDILVSLSTSPANGIVTVYKDWKESYLDYPYKKEVE